MEEPNNINSSMNMSGTKKTLSNPFTIASLSSIVSIVVTIVGGIFFLDDRYAHAEDVKEDQHEIILQQTQIKKELEHSINDIVKQLKLNDLEVRILEAEDQIYFLNTIPNEQKSNQQKAQLERFKSRLQDMRATRRVLSDTN